MVLCVVGSVVVVQVVFVVMLSVVMLSVVLLVVLSEVLSACCRRVGRWSNTTQPTR